MADIQESQSSVNEAQRQQRERRNALPGKSDGDDGGAFSDKLSEFLNQFIENDGVVGDVGSVEGGNIDTDSSTSDKNTTPLTRPFGQSPAALAAKKQVQFESELLQSLDHRTRLRRGLDT